MENANQTDDFVLTAEVEDYVQVVEDTQDLPEVITDVITDPQGPVIQDALVDIAEIELQPTDGQEAPQEAPEITQIEDGVYLDANGQGLEAALAAYQEAVSEGVDFGGEAGTWYYQGGAFAFIGA